jgi:CBS domain-containing protein
VRCDEYMTREIEVVEPGDNLREAARKMRDENVGFLPVCREDGAVVGTVTDRDLVIRAIAEDLAPASTPVEQVMSSNIVACKPSDDVKRAIELMRVNQVQRVLCIDDDGRLAGVISLSDLAQEDEDVRTARLVQDVTEREAKIH